MARDSIIFEIKRRIGIIEKNERTGWTKELNLVSWNEGKAKYDIRSWDENHEHMTRGITLPEDEARELAILLNAEFPQNEQE